MNRRNLHNVDRLCHVGRRGSMYFWDKKGGGNDSRNIGQGETRGESADWAAGQVGRGDMRQGEETFLRQTWLSQRSSDDAAPGEATAAAVVGDSDQRGREEREEAEGAVVASNPRDDTLSSVQGQVQLCPKLLGICRRQRSNPATATNL